MCVLSSNDTFANVLQDFRLNNFSAFVIYLDVMVIVLVVIAILTVQMVVMSVDNSGQ